MRSILRSLFLLILCSGCKDDQNLDSVNDFLVLESVDVSDLYGEWVWLNTHSGFSGLSKITPETENFEKSVIFTSNRTYSEVIDDVFQYENYYRIDSTILDHYGKPIFELLFFDDNKMPQHFIIQNENDTSYLYLYDTDDCRDCLSTHVFWKQ